jgi:hypothetical protein
MDTVNTEKLIRLVHLRKGLWEREHPAHRSLYALNELWEEVARELNSTSPVVKVKWRSLRRGFTTRLKQMPVSTYCHADVEFSNYTRWPYFKHLYYLKDQYTPHASSEDITPQKKKNLRDDQTDLQARGLETSQLSCSGKELRPSNKAPKRKSGDDVLDFSDNSTVPNCKRLCLQKQQFTFHARTRDLPPGKEKDIWHIPIDKLDGESVISEDGRYAKQRKPGAKLPRRSKVIASEESPGDSNLPHLTRLCRQKDQFMSHASKKDLPPKRKGFGDIQTDTRDGEVESSQYSAARKKLKKNAEVPTTRTRDPGLEFSNSSALPICKHFHLQKHQQIPLASSGDVPPKENTTSRDDEMKSYKGQH